MEKAYIVVTERCIDEGEWLEWIPTGIFRTMEAANAYIDSELIPAYRKGEINVDGTKFIVNSIDRTESGAKIIGSAFWDCEDNISILTLEYCE